MKEKFNVYYRFGGKPLMIQIAAKDVKRASFIARMKGLKDVYLIIPAYFA